MLSDGEYGIVSKTITEHLSEPETTYNFEVEDFHTYYVGKVGVCVHNNCAFDKMYNDPGSIVGKSTDDVGSMLGDDFVRMKHDHRPGGWKFMDKHSNIVSYNPAGGRHATAYYTLNKANTFGRLKVIGAGTGR